MPPLIDSRAPGVHRIASAWPGTIESRCDAGAQRLVVRWRWKGVAEIACVPFVLAAFVLCLWHYSVWVMRDPIAWWRPWASGASVALALLALALVPIARETTITPGSIARRWRWGPLAFKATRTEATTSVRLDPAFFIGGIFVVRGRNIDFGVVDAGFLVRIEWDGGSEIVGGYPKRDRAQRVASTIRPCVADQSTERRPGPRPRVAYARIATLFEPDRIE